MSPSTLSLTPSMLALSTVTALLLSVVSAQQTASIFIVNADPQPLVGSILGTNGATTTYLIQCQPGTDSVDCGVPGPFTYIKEGSSSIQYTIGAEGVTGTVGCSLGGTTTAVCTAAGIAAGDDDEETATGTGDGAEGTATGTAAMETAVITTTLGPDDIHFTQIPITGAVATAAQSTGAASSTPSANVASRTTSATAESTRGATAGSTTGTSTGSTTANSGAATGPAAANPGTSGAGSVNSRSIIALIGAATIALLAI